MNVSKFNELHPTSIVSGNSTWFSTTTVNFNIVSEDLFVVGKENWTNNVVAETNHAL